MHSVTMVDKDQEGKVINTRTINLELRVSPHGEGFKYEVLSNGTDVVCIQEFDPTLP